MYAALSVRVKHSNTLKCLIAVTPNGGACFVSDLFEGDMGDIDDVQILKAVVF